jgi:uncharacterized protein YgiM (DUF1202 family)
MKMPALALIALLAAGMAHAESARTVRAAELRADSQSDAATLATIPENTKLDVIQRRGAWSQVKTAGGQTGWVRMLSLRFEAAGADPGKSASGLSTLLNSGRIANAGTDTTGVRGLNEEDLRNAQANPAELQKMLKFTSDKSVAQNFAKRTKLTAVKVTYLPDPAARGDSPRKEAN